jgi:hypothetical protein
MAWSKHATWERQARNAVMAMVCADYVGQTSEWCEKMLEVKTTVEVVYGMVVGAGGGKLWQLCDDLACDVGVS